MAPRQNPRGRFEGDEVVASCSGYCPCGRDCGIMVCEWHYVSWMQTTVKRCLGHGSKGKIPISQVLGTCFSFTSFSDVFGVLSILDPQPIKRFVHV